MTQVKNTQCGMIFCIWTGIILGVSQFMIFGFAAGTFQFGSEDFIKALKHNLMADFVFSMSPQSEDPPAIQAFVEDWPGTIEGCNCLGIHGSS